VQRVAQDILGATLEHFLKNGRCGPGDPDDAMGRTSSHAFSCKFIHGVGDAAG
jgi:hypothetical protein